MTSDRTTTTRRLGLGGWPVASVIAVPLTALLISAGPVQGSRAAVPAGDPPVATSSVASDPSPTAPEPSTPLPSDPATTPASPPSTSPATPTAGPTPAPSATDGPTPTPASTTAADPPVTVGPGLGGGLATIATLGASGAPATYLLPGEVASGLLPFQTFRVTVQLLNGGADPVRVVPRLEFRAAGAADFQVVPGYAVTGVPLHVTQEWVPAKGGTAPAGLRVTIPANDLRLTAPASLTPTAGQRTSGVNPADPLPLPPGSVTEQEFTVTLSVDAEYGATYELRVTDAGVAIPGLSTALTTVGLAPDPLLSPGQRSGSPAPSASAATSATAVPAYPLVGLTATAAATPYALVRAASSSPSAATVPVTIGPGGPGTIHDPGGSTTSGQCGVCHQTHSAASQNLVKATSTTEQCYTCHAGGVGGADVQGEYTLGQPPNDPDTRSYWSHDTSGSSGHTLDSRDEFEGTLTRHSQCTDCHDPHGAKVTKPVMTPEGWTAPGGLAKVSGVAVTNGAAGTSPTYTWLDGTVQPVTAEYQLCFKCHSGFTTLPPDVPGKPSQNVTDLAVDLNPANPSYHPIEAPGRNQSQKLADSLAGSSPYKLWNFTTNDTVRCVSCHASNATGTSTDPAQNAPDATLTVHASTNRGILVRPYENRVLSTSGQLYDNRGFALCLTCHMETPYLNKYRPAAAEGTNFVFHGLHVAGISGKGSGGLDIDTPGAGQGNARCAECHFSSHGTTQPPTDQQVSGDSLVVFAPDVLPSRSMGGVPTFTRTATGGSCTLTCHGKDHQGATYDR